MSRPSPACSTSPPGFFALLAPPAGTYLVEGAGTFAGASALTAATPPVSIVGIRLGTDR